jgi:hypothetical protein
LENELSIGDSPLMVQRVQYLTTIEESGGVVTLEVHERSAEGTRMIALLTCAPAPVDVLARVLRGLLDQFFPLL